jgi:ATP-dependent helicase/nuclease subunit B
MSVFGRIDRADKFYDGEDRLFVRVIDYKSSAKEFNFALIKEGIQLQLLTYLKTVTANGGQYLDFNGEILPGAALYAAVDDGIAGFSYKPAPYEVEAKIKEKFTLKGIVLNDLSLIGAIDRELTRQIKYKSDVCDIKTDKEGNFSIKNLLFLEQFNKLLSECETIVKTAGEGIAGGYIPLKPYKYGKEEGCGYCAYKSVCLFDSGMYEYNRVGKLTKDEFFE